MNTEIHLARDNRDVQELNTFFEAMCLSSDIRETNNSKNESMKVKAMLNYWSDSAKVQLDLYSNKDSVLLKLKQMNISCCGLSQVPNVVFYLKYLNVLDLSHNSLQILPEEIGNLCNLVTLKLTGNELNCLPKSFKHIQQLNYLDLSLNKFSEVPDVLFYNLRVLKVLDLSSNAITKFDDAPACLNKLIILSLSNNFLKKLPVWIFDNLCQLQFLDISKNQCHFNVQCINYCNNRIFESLQLLNVENCNFSYENIQVLSYFKHLKVLYLGNKKALNKVLKGKNYLGNFTTGIFKYFGEIKYLYLQNTQIATLPTDFECLKNIEILNISDNLLSWLPECFCQLVSLKILHLTSNQLLFLPVNIGNLVNLKQIHLGNNKLCHIPESFYNLTNLEFIDLYNNQIEKVKPSIFKLQNLKGIDLGLNFLQFSFYDNCVNAEEIKTLYGNLRDNFRSHFHYKECRCDLQMVKSDKTPDEIHSDSYSWSNRCSVNSFESEALSDLEDSAISVIQKSYLEDEDWENQESHQGEEDDLFDPNVVDNFQIPCRSWRLDFQKNYCPANYHAPSIMKTYVKNFRVAWKNENVEEGQFDSD